jgi:serpin B
MSPKHGLLALFIAAAPVGAATLSAATPSGSIDVSAADNAFGFRLLNAVQTTSPDANVVLSPVSAALNLSMALEGAADQTRQEMLAALSLTGARLDAVNAANAQLIKLIRTPVKGVTLSVADSMWVDSRRATFSPDFVKRVQASYDAQMMAVDFSGPGVASQINGWASRQTRGAIPQVIDRIDPADLALLLNAVYFKGEWTHKFDKAKTQQRDFELAGGSKKQVSRMSQSGRFEYFETPEMQAIRLPMGEGDLVMDVLLPTGSSGLRTLEGKLTPENWASWEKQFASHPGTIELPRFELKSNYRLNGPLQALGVRRAFDPTGAQLTGMFSAAPGQAGIGHFFISSVRQSTYWKVDEEGAEAAAATTTIVRPTAVARPEQPFRMIVDRPFFCAIRDQRSGALLFLGAIYDPTA